MKRIISLMLVCVLSLTIIPQSNAVTQRELNEENANLYNTEMITYFEQEVGYPDHYGGAWLNQNSGHLVIGLTERNEEIEQYYYDVTGADILEFETVEYSLQELYDAMVETAENVSRTRSLPQVNGGAILQHSNSVEVYVLEEDAVAYISESNITVIPALELEYAKSNEIVNYKAVSSTVLEADAGAPGYGYIADIDDNIWGSVGYLAYRYDSNGQKETGFVTAGHVLRIERDGHVYNSSEEHIGFRTFTEADIYTGPSTPYDPCDPNRLDALDSAFVELDSNATITNVIRNDTAYSQDMSVRYIIPAEGSTIYKSGNVTGCTSGQVHSLYYVTETDYETGPFVRRILAGYRSDGGDSGCIVYTRNSGNKARVVGIHQGYKTIGLITYRLVVSAYNIQGAYAIYAGE